MAVPNKTVNGVTVEALLINYEHKPENVQRIAHRKEGTLAEIAIAEPDVQWPAHFRTFESRILAAFSQREGCDDASRVTILSINHYGSTSVPNLPAKAVIDIDLVLSPNTLASESIYMPRLEAAGFRFLFREPAWNEHRFLVADEPMSCNLHIWGNHCPEVERHRIFRDWLREHEDDRELYARTKIESAALSREKGEDVMGYNFRKQEVIHAILTRAFTKLGYLSS